MSNPSTKWLGHRLYEKSSMYARRWYLVGEVTSVVGLSDATVCHVKTDIGLFENRYVPHDTTEYRTEEELCPLIHD